MISFSDHVCVIFFSCFFNDRDCLSASTERPCCCVNGTLPTAGLGTGSTDTQREIERGEGGSCGGRGARTKRKKNVSGIMEETGSDISVMP